ncbi:chitosanase [Streptomyces camponoticapitis]|uniref:Chitosanase n=1 Tax=Streptomyces camponoticapitis TaxID=1616125 RepID=A0ABQ2E3J4_9ACTN|nr:chitosanase [Streptomyces camponoticapitis]GGJ85981.1 chitosanase [Streptomyces camponoticapitis]
MPYALRRPLLATLVALVLLCTACTAAAREDTPTALDDPAKKEIAMRLVSSAENSSLDWKAQYRYIEDIGDGRGYTAGIIGFCTGCGDLLKVVERYVAARPDGNVLGPFLPALRAVRGDSHKGLGTAFTRAWQRAADEDPAFRKAQDDERDRGYFDPAVRAAKADGLGALGQFVYYDAYVMHGSGDTRGLIGFRTMREQALQKAESPAKGGDETAYLNAFLDARVAAMRREPAHSDTSRVDTAQRVFLDAGNLDLQPPLKWKVYGESYRVDGG